MAYRLIAHFLMFCLRTSFREIFSWEVQHGHVNTEYDWQQLYHAAVLEADWTKIEDRIWEAESGIRARLYELSMDQGTTAEENESIVEALNGLTVLRKAVLAWQGSNRSLVARATFF
jgi:hypothetical protein